jgi:hypothetical protein
MAAPVSIAADCPASDGGNEGGGGEGGGETVSNEEDEETSSSSFTGAIRTNNGPFKIYKVRKFDTISHDELENAKKYAESKKGKCLSSILCENGMLTFICALGHSFKLPANVKTEWCSKCSEIIQQLTEFAKSYRSALSFRYGEKAIILKCSKGHEWQVDIKYKNLRRKKWKWCETCIKQDLEETTKEYQRKQEALFQLEKERMIRSITISDILENSESVKRRM